MASAASTGENNLEAHLQQGHVLLLHDAVLEHCHGEALYLKRCQSTRSQSDALVFPVFEKELHKRTAPFVERQLGMKIC